jgi:O-antigen/teichoic acid export membrane protein
MLKSPAAGVTMTDQGRRSPEWDVRFGAANYAALVLSYAATAIASLAAVSLLTRALPPERYGLVIAMLAAAMFAQQIGVSWTALSMSALGGAEFIEHGRIANIFWTRLGILMLNLALLALTAGWWLPWCQSILKLDATQAGPVLAYMGALALWLHVQQTLIAAKRIALQAALTLVDRLFVLACVIALYANARMSVEVVVGVYALSALLVSLAALVPLRHLLLPVVAFREQAARRILRFSLPLLPGAVANFAASNHLSTFFLAYFAGAAAVAAFGVAYQIHGAVVQFPLMAGIVLQPYFVTLHAADRARSTGPMFTSFVQACCVALSAVCLVIAALGGPLMVRLFGSAYAGAGPLLWPLMASAALAAPALMAWLPLATATQKSYILAVNAASTAIFNIALHWLLAPRYGPAGAAWAILISYIGTAIVTIVCLRRERLPDCVEAIVAALPPAVAALVALRGGVLVPLLAGTAALAAVALWQRATLRHGVRVAFQLAAGARS